MRCGGTVVSQLRAGPWASMSSCGEAVAELCRLAVLGASCEAAAQGRAGQGRRARGFGKMWLGEEAGLLRERTEIREHVDLDGT